MTKPPNKRRTRDATAEIITPLLHTKDHSMHPKLTCNVLWQVTIICAGFFVVSSAQGEDAGFISIFDGKTLNGWHKNPEKIGHGTGGQWTVEDGAITGQQDPPGSGNGGILLTDKKYGDVELLIDLKPD